MRSTAFFASLISGFISTRGNSRSMSSQRNKYAAWFSAQLPLNVGKARKHPSDSQCQAVSIPSYEGAVR
jgi:hypothetical protein